MTTKLFLHFLNDMLQMSKFKFFVLQDKFYRIAQMLLNFANVKCTWKIENFKNIICLKTVENLALY